jgi:hypothetical protein
MDALAAGHDAAVQMIDTSVVQAHQHGVCITDNDRQDMGPSRGELTSKIHAVVDSNGLPVPSRARRGARQSAVFCFLSALLQTADYTLLSNSAPRANLILSP